MILNDLDHFHKKINITMFDLDHGGALAFPVTDDHMAELVQLLAETDDAQGWLRFEFDC